MKKNRILIKHDTEEHWAKAKNFIPLAGELIIYDGVLENNKYIKFPRVKIGDGKTNLQDLPFVNFDVKGKESPKYIGDDTIEIF